jgi:hypothetical protein
MKIYGLLNGFFYLIFGAYGVFLPKHLAAETMGWTPGLLGLHQIRALWMACIGFGVICVIIALKGDRAALTKGIIFITLCFMVGRIFGLLIDGAGPQQTYVEIGIEIIWAGIGLFLLSRHKSGSGSLRS